MVIGERIRQLRQERKWTQIDLSKKLHIHQKQVSNYERGITTPSTEMLKRIAEVFGVSLEYLVYEQQENGAPPLRGKLQDRELMRRFEVLDTLPEQYRVFAREMLDLVIMRHRFQEIASNGPLGLHELHPA